MYNIREMVDFTAGSILERKIRVVDGLVAHPVPALRLQRLRHKLAAATFNTRIWWENDGASDLLLPLDT